MARDRRKCRISRFRCKLRKKIRNVNNQRHTVNDNDVHDNVQCSDDDHSGDESGDSDADSTSDYEADQFNCADDVVASESSDNDDSDEDGSDCDGDDDIEQHTALRNPPISIHGEKYYMDELRTMGLESHLIRWIGDVYQVNSKENAKQVVDRTSSFLAFVQIEYVFEPSVCTAIKRVFEHMPILDTFCDYLMNKKYKPSEYSFDLFSNNNLNN